MTFGTLIRRSLRFHARAHLGVAIGAAVGSAALIGALVIGDSVRDTLRERALSRLAGTYFALAAQDRTFRSDPIAFNPVSYMDPSGTNTSIVILMPLLPATSGQESMISRPWSTKVLLLPGTASVPSGTARANQIQVYGVDKQFWNFVGASGFAPA